MGNEFSKRFTIAVMLVCWFIADTTAGQPQRAEVWTERVARTGAIVLNLRVQQFDSRRQLVLRLRGDALNPPQLPFDIDLPHPAVATTAGTPVIGDARLCVIAERGDDCKPIAVTATIYAIGVTEGAEVQGLVTSVEGVGVVPADRAVFVGWVRTASMPRSNNR